MRDCSKRIYLSIFWIIVGAALFAAGFFEKIDSFWSGMGGALIGVGIVETIRWARYRNNPEWAGYLSVLTGAAAAITFKIAGMEDISYFCSIAVCLLMILYWICWLVLKRKY